VVRLCVTGEVDLATSALLAVTIRDAITAGQVERLVVDLDKVTFLDSAGVAALVAGHRLAAEHGVTYLVTQPPDRAGPTMDITGVRSALQ
jgi:anti-anti-sigma factor